MGAKQNVICGIV